MWHFLLKETWSLHVELGVREVAACDSLGSGRKVSEWVVAAADVDGMAYNTPGKPGASGWFEGCMWVYVFLHAMAQSSWVEFT